MTKDLNIWNVYIAKCRNGELYVGISNDVNRRIKEHNTTVKCRYTRFRKPVRLLYCEQFCDRSSALKREAEIKRWRRDKKLALIDSKGK
ncbi:MAG: GIY-YIG nuclease family protein [Candidatus Omnitrophota bacterium]